MQRAGYNEDHELFLALQEHVIDGEERQRTVMMEQNIKLKQESTLLYKQLQNLAEKIKAENEETSNVEELPSGTPELPHPRDRISQAQIKVTKARVTLNINDAGWWYMVESNSMDPLLDEGATILAVKPTSEEDIAVGDIVVFKSATSPNHVVHRVIDTNSDENGIYYITKGDNNPREDTIKLRFNDIVAIVVGILY
jgi:signal peptidase I